MCEKAIARTNVRGRRRGCLYRSLLAPSQSSLAMVPVSVPGTPSTATIRYSHLLERLPTFTSTSNGRIQKANHNLKQH